MATRPRLLCRGAPSACSFLNGTWTLDPAEALVNGHPHFVHEGLHLYRTADGTWVVAPEVGAGLVYLMAASNGSHPNTVLSDEWRMPIDCDSQCKFVPCPSVAFTADGPNTEDDPFSIDELGRDFFFRVQLRRAVVWFRCPSVGEVFHSGAKSTGSRAKPGKRYCSICNACFSANNFKSQHLASLHTPAPPGAPVATADGQGGVLLMWEAVEPTRQVPVLGYRLEFSIDGGRSWQLALECHGAAEAVAALCALQLHQTYLFRVAAVGVAGVGPCSPASLPFDPGTPAPPDADFSEISSEIADFASDATSEISEAPLLGGLVGGRPSAPAAASTAAPATSPLMVADLDGTLVPMAPGLAEGWQLDELISVCDELSVGAAYGDPLHLDDETLYEHWRASPSESSLADDDSDCRPRFHRSINVAAADQGPASPDDTSCSSSAATTPRASAPPSTLASPAYPTPKRGHSQLLGGGEADEAQPEGLDENSGMSGLCDLDLAELDGPTGFDLKGDGGAYDQGTAAETSPGSSRRVRTRGKRPKYRKASSSDGTDGGAGVARLRAALAALPGPAKQHAITADRVRAVYAAGRAAEARLLLAHAAPATVRLCAAPAPGRRLAAPAAAASDGAADKLDEATEKRLAALAAPLCPARPAPAPVAAPTAASTAAATAAATGPAAALVGRLRRRVALPEHGPLARRRRAAAAAAGGLVATLGALLLALVLAPAAGRAGPLGGMPLWSPPPPPPPKCVWSWSAGCVADDGTSGVCELSGLMSCQARPV